ncbi:uncharacterized protein LOC135397442 [Ornithodoros turicata]|uniref:uncharacterized protein LOC135397442 n=1 Tax=Ornithodoros turicata TaxID=34597 RepID=UPI00313A1B66
MGRAHVLLIYPMKKVTTFFCPDIVRLTWNAADTLEEVLPGRNAEAIGSKRGVTFGHRTRTPSQGMQDYEFQHQVLKNLNILRLSIQQRGNCSQALYLLRAHS